MERCSRTERRGSDATCSKHEAQRTAVPPSQSAGSAQRPRGKRRERGGVQGRGEVVRKALPAPGVLSLVLSLHKQRKNGNRAVARNLAQISYFAVITFTVIPSTTCAATFPTYAVM